MSVNVKTEEGLLMVAGKPYSDEYVTPQMFGAVGDGVHDDTQAVSDAFNSGKDVFMPEGTYLVNEITLTKSVTITGMDESSVIKLNAPMTIRSCRPLITKVCFTANNSNMDYLIKLVSVFNVDIHKCYIYSSGLNCGIYLDGTDHCYYCRISGNRFSGFKTAIVLTHNANANNIENNEFYLCEIGVLIDSCNGLRITGNTFQDYKVSGVKLEYNNYGSVTKGNLIEGNYFEGSMEDSNVGDIDCSNHNKVTANYFICNHATYNRITKRIVVNEASENYKIIFNGNTYHDVNNITGFTRINEVPKEYLNTYKDSIKGILTIASNEDGSSDIIFVDHNGNAKKVPICRGDNNDIVFNSVEAKVINQYYGYGISLGYTANPSKDAGNYFFCVDSNKKRLVSTLDGKLVYYQTNDYGVTSGRQSNPVAAQMYFDATLGKPIWFNGSKWVDANGNEV